MTKTPDWLDVSEEHTDITLSRPLEIAGAKVSVIRMREPTVGDQRASDAAKGDEGAREISLMANLCELAPDDLHRLPLRDYKRLQAALVGFID